MRRTERPGRVVLLTIMALVLLPGYASGASLTTTFAAGNGADGNTFDLQVRPDRGVDITALDLHLDTGGIPMPVELWTRSGTSVGHEGSAAGWTWRWTVAVVGRGEGQQTRLDVPRLHLPQGEYGVLIGAVGSTVRYSNRLNGETYEDAALVLTPGAGLAAPFFSGPVYQERIWNGTIHYETDAPRIDSGPAGLVAERSPEFAFSVEGDPDAFECRLSPEGGPAPAFAACSGATTHRPAAPLPDGAYAFEVRMVETFPGASPTAVREFEVDATAPAPPAIDEGPSAESGERQPSFGFFSPEPVDFECRLYGAAEAPPSFGPCSGPGHSHRPATALAEGAYAFEVRAIDAAGNAGDPARREFSVRADPAPREVPVRADPAQACDSAEEDAAAAAAAAALSKSEKGKRDAARALARAKASGKRARVRRARAALARAGRAVSRDSRQLAFAQGRAEGACG